MKKEYVTKEDHIKAIDRINESFRYHINTMLKSQITYEKRKLWRDLVAGTHIVLILLFMILPFKPWADFLLTALVLTSGFYLMSNRITNRIAKW